MLNVMRKHAGSWMIKVILFAIVIVFIFWGVGSFRSRQASKVATVNDEVITVTEFQRAYNNLIEQYRQRFGSSLNDGMLEMLKVKSQAVNQLVDRAILLQEARKRGLQVSDAEVADAILKIPVFQSNGSFDINRYRNILSQVHLTPEEFEADQKNVLLGQKLSRVIAGAAKVSETEARQYFDWLNTSVNVDYILFSPTSHADVTPTEEAIAAYFEENKEKYKTEPMLKARYVVFDPADQKGQATVSDDEIKDYYETNPDEFKTEKTVEARHVLIKVPDGGDAAADAAAQAKAAEVAAKAKAGEDFAELAKTFSEGPTKDRGGYLGKFTRARMVAPFADKAFSMAPGEISDPVKTQFGWHVIKVESVEDATTKTIEESRSQIEQKLIEKKAKALAYDKAEQFFDSTFEKEDLIKNAAAAGLTVMETGAFDRRGPDALGNDKSAFARAAFEQNVDEISDIKEIGGRYYLIQVTETIPASIPERESVKTTVTADLKEKMQRESAREAAEKMAAELKTTPDLKTVADQLGLPIKQTGFFERDGVIPEIGSDPAFNQAAFALTETQRLRPEPVDGKAGFYLLQLVERKTPAEEDFAKDEKSVHDMLLRQKQQTVFEEWMTARRAESDIKLEPAYLD